jgi:hypothetical protein
MKIEISVTTHIGFVDLSEIKGTFHQDQNGYSTVTLPLLYELHEGPYHGQSEHFLQKNRDWIRYVKCQGTLYEDRSSNSSVTRFLS